jgi:hypothetical protein
VRVRTYWFPGCFTRPPGTSTRNHPHEPTTSKPVVPRGVCTYLSLAGRGAQAELIRLRSARSSSRTAASSARRRERRGRESTRVESLEEPGGLPSRERRLVRAARPLTSIGLALCDSNTASVGERRGGPPARSSRPGTSMPQRAGNGCVCGRPVSAGRRAGRAASRGAARARGSTRACRGRPCPAPARSPPWRASPRSRCGWGPA